MNRIFLLLALALTQLSAHADVFKCVNKGKTEYSSEPCQNARKMAILPAPEAGDVAAAKNRAAVDYAAAHPKAKEKPAEIAGNVDMKDAQHDMRVLKAQQAQMRAAIWKMNNDRLFGR